MEEDMEVDTEIMEDMEVDTEVTEDMEATDLVSKGKHIVLYHGHK